MSRVVVVGLTIALGLAFGGAGVWIAKRSPARHPPRVRGVTPTGEPIPPEGLLVSEGSYKGDVQNAVKAFKRIYAAVDAYRRKYNDLPSREQLLDTSKPLVDGYQLAPADFDNPDRVYADSKPDASEKCVYGIALGNAKVRAKPKAHPGHRLDGTPFSVFPEGRERDIWLGCDLYARQRQFMRADGKSEIWVHGHYVLLWSDGTVEIVPAKDVFMLQTDKRAWTRVFKGQAGLPPGPLIPYKAFNQAHGGRTNTWHYEEGKP